MLLSSVLLIYQFRSLWCGLNFSQLAPFPYLYPYSVQTLSHVAWWGKEIWVSINKLEMLYVKSYGQRRYWTVLGTFDTNSWGWECDYPNPPALTVGQHGNMQQMKRQEGQPALPCLLLGITSDTVVEGVPLVCCITRCSAASPSPAVPLVAGLPNEIQQY